MEVISTRAVLSCERYNEAEVRFYIIDPVLRNLGYPDSENVYLNLEEKLEYPYIHIGRRSRKDVPLGFPDYRAGLTGARGSFVVEAKAGSVPLTSLEVEQAHSYAAHAQVGANYFVLCNGLEIRIYETLSGPDAAALVTIPLPEINTRFHEIQGVLSPVNLERNCKVEYDMKLRLCDGLGSSAVVRSGSYSLSEFEYRLYLDGKDCTALLKTSMPHLRELDTQLELFKTAFELRVASGSVSRDEEGRINAEVHFAGVTVHNAIAMQLMGLDRAFFVTSDKFLSTDSTSPTMFESTQDFAVSKGALVPQLFGGLSEMEADVQGEMYIRAAMYVEGREICGQYLGIADYFFSMPDEGILKMELDFTGEFAIQLDA